MSFISNNSSFHSGPWHAAQALYDNHSKHIWSGTSCLRASPWRAESQRALLTGACWTRVHGLPWDSGVKSRIRTYFSSWVSAQGVQLHSSVFSWVRGQAFSEKNYITVPCSTTVFMESRKDHPVFLPQSFCFCFPKLLNFQVFPYLQNCLLVSFLKENKIFRLSCYNQT